MSSVVALEVAGGGIRGKDKEDTFAHLIDLLTHWHHLKLAEAFEEAEFLHEQSPQTGVVKPF